MLVCVCVCFLGFNPLQDFYNLLGSYLMLDIHHQCEPWIRKAWLTQFINPTKNQGQPVWTIRFFHGESD